MSKGMPPARPRTSTRNPPAAPRPRTSSSVAIERSNRRSKLVCTLGPSAGSEFLLTDGEVVVGRALDNVVSIPDTSVSRKHVLLRQSGAGWLVSDMGSGNGTWVNGEPIAQETLLRNGDVIGIGDTELSFAETNEQQTDRRLAPSQPVTGRVPREMMAPRARTMTRPRSSRGSSIVSPEEKANKRRLLLVAVLGVALVAMVLGGLRLYHLNKQRRELAEQAAVQKARSEIGAIFQEGKNLVREGRWADAKVKFEEMKEINPDYPTLQDYLDRAEREIPNEAQLKIATAAIAKGQMGPTAGALGKISKDTQLYTQVREVRDHLEERRVAAMNQSRSLVGSGSRDLEKMTQLVALTDDVLAAFPDNRDALELNKQAKVRVTELSRPAVVAAPVAARPWAAATDAFREGKLPEALAAANECRVPHCKVIAGQLKVFGERYKKVDTLSVQQLGDLGEMEESLSEGSPSTFHKAISERIVAIFYKVALAAKSSGDWNKATEAVRRVLRVEPGHAGALAISNDLKSQAHYIFLRAYALKETNPDEAVKLLHDVLEMTPKDDDNHIKAQTWVEKLSR